MQQRGGAVKLTDCSDDGHFRSPFACKVFGIEFDERSNFN